MLLEFAISRVPFIQVSFFVSIHAEASTEHAKVLSTQAEMGEATFYH